jgi:hypothetical protein
MANVDWGSPNRAIAVFSVFFNVCTYSQTAKKTRQTIDNKIQSQIVKSRDCYINVRNKGQTITGVGKSVEKPVDLEYVIGK